MKPLFLMGRWGFAAGFRRAQTMARVGFVIASVAFLVRYAVAGDVPLLPLIPFVGVCYVAFFWKSPRPSPAETFNDILDIDGPPNFRAHIRALLYQITRTMTGQEVLRQLRKRGRRIAVVLNEKYDTVAGDVVFVQQDIDVCGLIHELVHATRNEVFLMALLWSSALFRREERRTTGLAPAFNAKGETVRDEYGELAGTHIKVAGQFLQAADYSRDFPSENSLRYELGIPLRESYLKDSPEDEW